MFKEWWCRLRQGSEQNSSRRWLCPITAADRTLRGHPVGDHFDGTYVTVEEPSTASEADMGESDAIASGRASPLKPLDRCQAHRSRRPYQPVSIWIVVCLMVQCSIARRGRLDQRTHRASVELPRFGDRFCGHEGDNRCGSGPIVRRLRRRTGARISYPPQVSATYPPTYPTYWPYAGYYPAYYPYYSSPFWGPQVGIGAGFFFGGHRHHRGFGHGHGRHFR
jgi:hypothetical protein